MWILVIIVVLAVLTQAWRALRALSSAAGSTGTPGAVLTHGAHPVLYCRDSSSEPRHVPFRTVLIVDPQNDFATFPMPTCPSIRSAGSP